MYGELINVYGYNLEEGAKELLAPNFYDNNKEIRIPLDPTLSPQENSQKFFDRYGKLKRTAEALDKLLQETKAEIDHLESIQNSLDIALSADDLVQIKQELTEYGFIKKIVAEKKKKSKANRFIISLRMDMIFMLGKIITRTMNSLSSLQPETTGGSMQKECLVLMLS